MTEAAKRITANQKIRRAMEAEGYNPDQLVALIEQQAVDEYIHRLAREGRVVVSLSTLEGRRR